MLNVENKVIVITGASSGIGEASAKLPAENEVSHTQRKSKHPAYRCAEHKQSKVTIIVTLFEPG